MNRGRGKAPWLVLFCLAAGGPAWAETRSPAPPDVRAAAGSGDVQVADAVEPHALDGIGRQLAADAASLAPAATTRLALQVEASAPRLASAAELAIARALRRAGFAPPIAVRSRAEANDRGADAYLSIRLAARQGRLVAAGELRAVRENFFTGSALAAGGALAASVELDEAARLLAGAGGKLAVEVRPFAELGQPPLALAVGALAGGPFVAGITTDEIVLWDAGGSERARYALPPALPGALPSRDPRAGLVIAGGRIRYALPLRNRGEVLALEAGRLVAVAELPADVLPVAAGGKGVLGAQLVPGTNLFSPSLQRARPDAPAAPRVQGLGTPFVTALAAAGSASPPFGVIDPAGHFLPFGQDLERAGVSLAGLGDAAVLADLDGDGAAELVASARVAAPPDRVRVFRPGGEATTPIDAGEVPALLLTAAAGELGGGVDEVILGGADGSLFRLRRAP